MIKAFVDSDVILDALLRREPFYLPAINLLDLAHDLKIELCVSSVAFVNVNYFLRKASLINRIEHLVQLRSIIPIINVDGNIIDLALNSAFTDFEDAVQYYAAVSAKADYIITRNIKDYKYSTIPVLTAEHFLQTL
jgi:predicted nucleic acid-binding protein